MLPVRTLNRATHLRRILVHFGPFLWLTFERTTIKILHINGVGTQRIGTRDNCDEIQCNSKAWNKHMSWYRTWLGYKMKSGNRTAWELIVLRLMISGLKAKEQLWELATEACRKFIDKILSWSVTWKLVTDRTVRAHTSYTTESLKSCLSSNLLISLHHFVLGRPTVLNDLL